MQNKNVHRITNLSLITMILGLKAYMKKNDRNDSDQEARELDSAELFLIQKPCGDVGHDNSARRLGRVIDRQRHHAKERKLQKRRHTTHAATEERR